MNATTHVTKARNAMLKVESSNVDALILASTETTVNRERIPANAHLVPKERNV